MIWDGMYRRKAGYTIGDDHDATVGRYTAELFVRTQTHSTVYREIYCIYCTVESKKMHFQREHRVL